MTDRASSLLGRSIEVTFRSSDGTVAAPSEEAATDDEEIPDKDSLMEAPADGQDPMALLEDAFGATVVEEETT